jgi:PIN domain
VKPKHHIFLDANIYLRFYKLSDADVRELGQLVTLVKSGEVRLYLTEQGRDEFNRNRDEAVAESLKGVREQELKPSFPRMFRDHPGFPELRKAVKGYEDQRKQMLEDIGEAASRKELAADQLIAELFDLAELVPLTDVIWETARRRYDLRNPPGKGKSYGDAVHWVSLLEAVPNGEDILVVSDDSDFQSKLDKTQMSDFLQEEWRQRKNAAAVLYTALPHLFRDHYPDVRLLEALEIEMAERELAVRSLATSANFLQTHAAIEVVSRFSDFLPQEVEELLEAALRNTQIRWIVEDDDVFRFYTRLIHEYQDSLDPGLLAEFWGLFNNDGYDRDEE